VPCEPLKASLELVARDASARACLRLPPAQLRRSHLGADIAGVARGRRASRAPQATANSTIHA